MIFIDTDTLFDILYEDSKKGQDIFEKLEKSNEDFAITSITLYEIISYFKKSGRDVPPIHLLQVYGFSKEDAQKAADLEIELDKLKKNVAITSLMTAAIVMNKGGTLCTMNEGFKQLKDVGLKLFL